MFRRALRLLTSVMFNLLPKEEKATIRREYRVRLAVVVLWFSFVTVIVSSLLLLPAYFLSSQKEKAALRQAETLTKSVEAAEAANLEKVLVGVKGKLAYVDSEQPPLRLYELIREVAKRRSEGIAFTTLTVVDAEEEKRRININGRASTRGAIVAFEKALRGSGLFDRVELPVSSLAKDSNSEFAIDGVGDF